MNIYISIVWLLLFSSQVGFSQNLLQIPDTLSGNHFSLSMATGNVSFYPNTSTSSIGFNGNLLGPTLIFQKGDSVNIDVTNSINELTTVHWHGLHVSSENDGGPHTVIPIGATWSPTFKVLDYAGTYWYHPHLHQKTAEHVTKGAAGLIIVRDSIESSLDLPRTYGVDDIPIVIQSRAFDNTKQFVVESALDSVMLINGTKDSFYPLPAQIVRLRCLNGSTERVYNLGFEGNLTFSQIGSDGGLLEQPVSVTRLLLAPGERTELLIDLSGKQGQSIYLKSFASEMADGIYGASSPGIMPMGTIIGYQNNALNGSDFNLTRFEISAPSNQAVTAIPATLVSLSPYLSSNSNQTRILTFSPQQMGPNGMLNGPFLINGQSFDLNQIQYQIPLGNTEIWQLTNQTGIAHPFHIHDVQFYVLDVNGNPPGPSLSGRKDVVLVPAMGTVRFITRFEDFADPTTPFMYHCHMLSHEDDGMMGQFVVVDNSTVIEDGFESNFLIYPNPVHNGKLMLKTDIPVSIGDLELIDLRGRKYKIWPVANKPYEIMIPVKELSNGIYFLKIWVNERWYQQKILIYE